MYMSFFNNALKPIYVIDSSDAGAGIFRLWGSQMVLANTCVAVPELLSSTLVKQNPRYDPKCEYNLQSVVAGQRRRLGWFMQFISTVAIAFHAHSNEDDYEDDKWIWDA